MRVRLPLDTFSLSQPQQESNEMTNNTNNLPLTHADGTINGDNPLVCAAVIDGMGQLMLATMHEIKNDDHLLSMMSDDVKHNLDTVFRTMQLLRNCIGIESDWGSQNQSHLVQKIHAEAARKREIYNQSLAKALIDAGIPLDLIPPEMRPKPDAASSADALLAQLRADGVIG